MSSARLTSASKRRRDSGCAAAKRSQDPCPSIVGLAPEPCDPPTPTTEDACVIRRYGGIVTRPTTILGPFTCMGVANARGLALNNLLGWWWADPICGPGPDLVGPGRSKGSIRSSSIVLVGPASRVSTCGAG